MTNNLVIFTMVVLIAIFGILFTFDTWQTILFVSFTLICVSYIIILGLDKLTAINYTPIREGFTTNMDDDTDDIDETHDADNTDKTSKTSKTSKTKNSTSDANKSKYEWLTNENLFDDFYASIFTKLTQNEKLIEAETAICMEEFTKKIDRDNLNILDAACGIGIGTSSFAKLGAGSVVGIDKSKAMINYAKGTTLPDTTLTETQRQNVEFRQLDLLRPDTASASEFTSVCLLYFSVYYFPDLDMLFRNLHLWIKPGGTLAIEVVNKYKFEPVLDSANPWIGFSPQKYSKERINKSNVVFDKFDYQAVFELDDPTAEFRETFRFKDGSTRRQKHKLYMAGIPDIIKKAQNVGFTYTKYVDLTPFSFPYGYILFFNRNDE
jgi:SAM-dependent methyltransferase